MPAARSRMRGSRSLALSLEGDVRNESRVSSQTPASSASVPGGSLVILYLAA